MINRNSITALTKQFVYEYYFRAITVHKTHKNDRLDIPKGSFLETIYKDTSNFLTIIKSTQTGISEYLIVRALSRAEKGRGILYVLPTFDLKGQFVKERIDKPMAFSPYYQSLLTNTGLKRFAESMSLKQIKTGSIAFVGSNTSNAFISYPADDVIIDEFDSCNQDNIAMARERQSASKDPQTVYVGNPTITGFGLDLEIQKTDEKEWRIKHDVCGTWITPNFFKDVVKEVDEDVFILRDEKYDRELKRDIYPICPGCGKPYDRKINGLWVKQRNNKDRSGYRVSKMFSTRVKMKEMVEAFDAGLKDDKKLERFYNADLGLAYQPEGSKIFPYMLDECIRDYIMPGHSTAVTAMGVDVGKYLHVTIGKFTPDGEIRIVYVGTVHEEEDVAELYQRYNCKVGVIDALPETRLSKSLCYRFKGMFRWFRQSEKADRVHPKDKIVNANRTEIIDAVKNYVISQTLLLPKNIKSIPDFYDQVTAPTRIFNEVKNVYYWDEGSKADHYCFSLAYMILAKRIIAMVGK